MIRLCLYISIHHTSSASNSVLDQTEIENTISFSIRFSSRIGGAQKYYKNCITSLCLLYCFSYTASLALMSCCFVGLFWCLCTSMIVFWLTDCYPHWFCVTAQGLAGEGEQTRATTWSELVPDLHAVVAAMERLCQICESAICLFSLYITMKRLITFLFLFCFEIRLL